MARKKSSKREDLLTHQRNTLIGSVIIALAIVIAAYLLSSTKVSTVVQYVCEDGRLVDDVSSCTTTTTVIITTTTTQVEVEEEYISNFSISWAGFSKDIVCADNYCDIYDCNRNSGLITADADISTLSYCDLLLDEEIKYDDIQSEDLGTGTYSRISMHMQSETDPGKPTFWDDHEVTLCCYARGDPNKEETCINSTLEALCP